MSLLSRSECDGAVTKQRSESLYIPLNGFTIYIFSFKLSAYKDKIYILIQFAEVA